MIEIYDSTTYVDPSKNKEWLKLKVISQWDFSSNAVCYQWVNGFLGNKKELISYKLEKHTSTSDTTSLYETIETLTDEMKKQLIKKGYEIAREQKT